MFTLADCGVVLRKFEQYDVEDLFEFRNDLDVTSGLGGFSTGYSTKDLADWVEYHRTRKDEILFAIVDENSNRCIGHVGLYQIDARSQKGDFGILLGRSGQGRGYGRIVTRFMLDFGFQELNLHKISLSVLESNQRAARLYESVGFVQEGRLRDELWRNGRFNNVLRMSILRSEWAG